MKALNLRKHTERRPKGDAARPARARGSGRGVTVAALTMALGAAVYLNWSFAGNAPVLAAGSGADGSVVEVMAPDTAMAEADVAVYDPLQEESVAVDAPQTGAPQTANKNYGEAQLVSVNRDSGTEFFEQARLTRSKARDEALEELESALKKAELSQEEKESLTARLSAQVAFVTKESDLETLIKAKGFADCVVMLSTEGANVTVMTENDALSAEEVTRIRDVVLSRCPDLDAQAITVVEVK